MGKITILCDKAEDQRSGKTEKRYGQIGRNKTFVVYLDLLSLQMNNNCTLHCDSLVAGDQYAQLIRPCYL